jgi:hypothetical protein
MAEPNPVWGVHVVCGAVTAALLRRTETGAYEILDSVAERAPDDAVGAVRHARAVLSRRGVAARGALVALPDANGCLVTATIPPEELDLSEHEIGNEMYEWTPFEPDQAELRHRRVVHEGRRQERLVAALPRADYRRFIEVLETGDASRLGVGFAAAATWRGARAMGLCPVDGFLVTTQPRLTEVYAWSGGRARRHVLPIGEDDLRGNATAVDVMARDLLQLADYHRALRREGDKPPADPRFAIAGFSATSPAVRQRLAAVLGPRLVEGAMSDSVVGMAQSAKPPGVPVAALAGAVGAALEALRPVDERLVLRHVSADLPPYRDTRPLVYSAVAVALIAAAGVYFGIYADLGEPPRTKTTEVAKRTEPPPSRTASVRTEPATHPAETAARASPVVAAALRVEATGPGRVRVAWDEGADGRALVRRFLGHDGGGPDGPTVQLRKIGRGAGAYVDDVPGATGLYAWSIGGGEETRAFVDVRIEIELLGPGDAGGARFALRRPWRDGTATLAVDVAPGGRVGGEDASVSFDTGLRLDAVRTRVETERAMARVPRFLTDGRVERGADGSAVTGERVVERERRIFEVDAAAPDGSRRTWSRKMTDG